MLPQAPLPWAPRQGLSSEAASYTGILLHDLQASFLIQLLSVWWGHRAVSRGGLFSCRAVLFLRCPPGCW